MRRGGLLATLAVLLGVGLPAARAGELPVTAEDALADRALGPEEHLMIAVPMKVAAIVPDGTPSPAVNLLGPLRRVAGQPGSITVPPCWLYVVEPAAPPGSGVPVSEYARLARDFGVPGLELRFQPGVDDATVGTLEGLDTLLYLGLSRTRVTDAALAHVALMPKLLAADLGGVAGISDRGLGYLAAHPTLAALRLQGARGVTDAGVGHLVGIRHLIWLDLSQTGVTDDGLAALAKAGRLRVLELEQCTGVTDKGITALARLESLRALGLASVPATDASLKRLAKVKSLEALDLGMTRVTERGIAQLKALPRLRWLSLSGLPVGDKAVTWLDRSKVLEALDLTDTNVGVRGLKALAGKASLEELKLRGPMLTDDGLEIVATCTNLRRLYLHNAGEVTDGGLARLAALKGLTAFGITAAPKITDAFLEVLAALPDLEWVNLDRCTGLTKEGVAKLKAAKPGCRVIDPWELGIK